MNERLQFVDVLQDGIGSHHRENDLSRFEYSFQAEITNVYPLTKTEKLYQIQISDEEKRHRFSL